jgi:hypothetical protein
LSALGAVLASVRGYGAPETGHAYARARELWEQLGSPMEFLRVPFGQSRYHADRGELDLAYRSDEDLLLLSVSGALSAPFGGLDRSRRARRGYWGVLLARRRLTGCRRASAAR